MVLGQAEGAIAFVGQPETAGSGQSHSVVHLASGQFDASMLRASLSYFHK